MSAARFFNSIFSRKNLKEIYLEKIQESTVRGIDRVRPEAIGKSLHVELAHISKKVRSKDYRYTAYKEKLVSKGAGRSPRVISIPTGRDRIVLRGLCDLLTKVFSEAVPEIPQVKIEALKGALEDERFQEFIKIDLKEFYPSISHTGMLAVLRRKIRKPEILSLLEGALTTPTVPESKGRKGAKASTQGVPQGLSISNLLAEIFLAKFDQEMKSNPDIWYRRYVDDILILCAEGQSGRIATGVCGALEQQGLSPHRLDDEGSKSKSGKLTDEFDFLGYLIANRRLSIRNASRHKFESSLAKICTGYQHKLRTARSPVDARRAAELCEWRLNLRITGCIFEGKRLGWVFYFSQINDTSRLRAVDHTVEMLLERFSLKGKIHAKRTLKAFYESRRKDKSDHRYIPNFDEMHVDEKRRILEILIGSPRVVGLSDSRIDELFRMKISDAVRELEEDLAGAS